MRKQLNLKQKEKIYFNMIFNNFPLKIFTSIWSEGFVVLFSMAGEGVRRSEASGCGVVVPPLGAGLGSLKLVNIAWGESDPEPPA